MKPVGDPVPRIGNEVAVGENLDFQRKWWSFERVVYIVFIAVVLLDLAGAFGRGYLAKAEATVSAGAARLKYDRVQRVGTPSILSVEFAPNVEQGSQLHIWMDGALTKRLGNQRIIPQPVSTTLENNGYEYSFRASQSPAMARFALQPIKPGVFTLRLRIGDRPESRLHIVVMP